MASVLELLGTIKSIYDNIQYVIASVTFLKDECRHLKAQIDPVYKQLNKLSERDDREAREFLKDVRTVMRVGIRCLDIRYL